MKEVSQEGLQGVFYPSGRQRYVISMTYRSSTRQITRQEASGTRQEMRLNRRQRRQLRRNKHSSRLSFLTHQFFPSAPVPELKRSSGQPNHNPKNQCPEA